MSRYTITKHISRLMVLLLCLTLLMTGAPVARAAESGTCGDGLSWSFDGVTLTISGSGAMPDYSEANLPPWYSFREEILCLSLPEGLTRVGDIAFYDCVNLRSVVIPASVEYIGEAAFYRNSGMTMLTLNSGIRTISASAFAQCSSLQDLRLPNTVVVIDDHAFYMCSSLTSVTVPNSVRSFGSGVFAYCQSLRYAELNASVAQLPGWTFYGCDLLTEVVVNGETVSADTLKVSNVPQSSDTSTLPDSPVAPETPNVDESITQSTTVNTTDNSTTVKTTTTEDSKITQVEVSSTVVNDEGWEEVMNQISSAERGADYTVLATIYIPGGDTVPESVLEELAGKNVELTIQTQSGSTFILNLADLDAKDIKGDLKLTYTLALEEDVPEELQGGTVYRLVFGQDVNMPVEVVMRLPGDYSYQTANLYRIDNSGTTHLLQSVMVDSSGKAHWYLSNIDEDYDYLIGINIPGVSGETPIIPEELQEDYNVINLDDGVEYVVTGRSSSWGVSLGQVMGILAVVMVSVVIVVGAVVYFWNKNRLKNGYVPELNDENE